MPFLYGYNLIITTRTVQARKHRKKRINKKWLKRYGTKKYDVLKDGQSIVFGNNIYLTEHDYKILKEKLNEQT